MRLSPIPLAVASLSLPRWSSRSCLGPLLVIVLFAFDKSNVQSLPIRHWTTHWFVVAFNDQAVAQFSMAERESGLRGDADRVGPRYARRFRDTPVPLLRS